MSRPQSNPQDPSPLNELIEAVLNGQADETQFAELQHRLQDDDAARDTYATYMNLHCELNERFAVEGDIVGLEVELEKELRDGELADLRRKLAAESIIHQSPQSTSRRMFAMATVAALALIGVFAWKITKRLPDDTSAQVRDLEGHVTIIGSNDTAAARIGDALRPGVRLRTDEQNARAVLEYVDGTTIAVHNASVVQVPMDSDVRLRLLSGSIEVDAAIQPADRPLTIATDHARYVVLGTRFRLYRSEDATRLELNEGTVRLERLADGNTVETVRVEAGNAVVASVDRAPLKVFPLAGGKARLHAKLAVHGRDMVLSPGGDLLVVNDAGQGLSICRTDGFAVESQWTRDVSVSYGLAFAPDSQTVMRLGTDNLLLWRSGEEETRKLPLPNRNVRSRALSPNGLFVAQSSDEGIEVSVIDATAGTLQRVAVLPNQNGRSGKAWCLGFSADGKRLVAGFWDGTLRVYDVVTLETVSEWKLAHTPTRAVLSNDGQHVAVFTRKDGVRLIDIATGRQHTMLPPTGTDAFSLKFTPDGRCLMAGCSDRTSRIWSVADGRALLVIDSEHSPRDMTWIDERRMLVTADESVKVWECEMP